jgi:hypothetical protein
LTTNVNVRRTAMVINIDLDLAVAFYETFFPSGQDATLIARVNRSDFYPAFNIVSDSLHRNAIMALCRIWDTQPDSANLNSLAKMFTNNQVLADIARAEHPVDPNQMKKWQADVAMVNTSDELKALMTMLARNCDLRSLASANCRLLSWISSNSRTFSIAITAWSPPPPPKSERKSEALLCGGNTAAPPLRP